MLIMVIQSGQRHLAAPTKGSGFMLRIIRSLRRDKCSIKWKKIFPPPPLRKLAGALNWALKLETPRAAAVVAAFRSFSAGPLARVPSPSLSLIRSSISLFTANGSSDGVSDGGGDAGGMIEERC